MRLLERVLKTIIIVVCIVTALWGFTAPAQTWLKVANENDTLTLSAAATVQFGVTTANAATCNGPRWIEGVYKLPATAPVISIASATFVASNGVFGKDPCPNFVKELDVLETATAQTVTVNGKPVPVPALPVTPPPVVTPPANTANFTINFTVTKSGVTSNVTATCTTVPTVQ